MDKVKIGFSIEYEDENNIVRNGLFLREPEIKELEKRLKEINKITDLKQQCKKQKEAINKAIEWVKDWRHGANDWFEEDSKPSELLDILNEVTNNE